MNHTEGARPVMSSQVEGFIRTAHKAQCERLKMVEAPVAT